MVEKDDIIGGYKVEGVVEEGGKKIIKLERGGSIDFKDPVALGSTKNTDDDDFFENPDALQISAEQGRVEDKFVAIVRKDDRTVASSEATREDKEIKI